MTEQVQGVIKSKAVEGRTADQKQKNLRHLYGGSGSRHHEEDVETDDQVDISEEARKRADGTYRKNILEHIEENRESGIN